MPPRHVQGTPPVRCPHATAQNGPPNAATTKLARRRSQERASRTGPAATPRLRLGCAEADASYVDRSAAIFHTVPQALRRCRIVPSSLWKVAGQRKSPPNMQCLTQGMCFFDRLTPAGRRIQGLATTSLREIGLAECVVAQSPASRRKAPAWRRCGAVRSQLGRRPTAPRAALERRAMFVSQEIITWSEL